VSDTTEQTLARWRRDIDAELAAVAAADLGVPERLSDAIHYSLTGEGKRFRGLLLLATYDASRGQGNATRLAAAVEVVHAYSLVHDDLPCMDNDSLRRGRPTTHRAFDVATATVAGVAMVPLAVALTLRAAESLQLRNGASKKLVHVLMDASGASGMVGGQLMDLEGEKRALTMGELEAVHRAKTGALITALSPTPGMPSGWRSRSRMTYWMPPNHPNPSAKPPEVTPRCPKAPTFHTWESRPRVSGASP
jgi:geranylgeranyl diphosphate synthase type II